MNADLPNCTFSLMKLRVFEEPHRFVLEVSIQPELIHEVWIEGEAQGQHQLQEPALAQSKNTLARDRGAAEDDDLSISRAIRIGDARDDAKQRMRERNRAPRCGPYGGIRSLRRGEDS